ncbi:hypothetical protein BAUCODRAFT_75194 [Baudoinia panamericana UAMH 10762]|uniref:Heme haloperoxidase family profile domain-containing protein n=1 Tax=Baudoinia panamericana (strain UAMH 10762) TaxID=717646 RepID=M2MQP7_BAUPA|nr:uncharacterized protein BAUCODRAFT_75194 [Baudoinia panamericana UAMH 10762]EMC93813.1 hypothetical protein BAUCODRAFT_75194 [Baudoinia panamericana UAMH 10762]
MGINSREEAVQFLKEKRDSDQVEDVEPEKRGLISGLLNTLASDITGLTGSVASAVDPKNYRPEPGYTFQAPGPNDSRGPCPGLNLLANYGYLPRNGYVNYGQVLDATARGFNMGADLATVLAVFTILADGDIATESWYLGAGPGNVGGLNRHDTAECDISPNREDYYLACGDNHHLSSRLFQQNVQAAAANPTKQFDLVTMGTQYASNAAFSLKNNPYLYYFPFPSIVSLGAFAFYPQFFSNGTYGAGGVANYESISSIIGAKFNKTSGQFSFVPEKWPSQGWYRRATPYGAVQALIDGFTIIYPRYPVPMAVPQLANPANLNVNTILCDIYDGINSITPLALGGTEQEVATAVSWALSKLEGVGISPSVLGCSIGNISPNFYPNMTQAGGPMNLPPAQQANTGNNVYNKTYFCNAPTTPQCSHTC